jgi:hypothetical protein
MLLSVDQRAFVTNRHNVTGIDYLTSWVLEDCGWVLCETSAYRDQPIMLIEKLSGGEPHPVISSSLFALQSRFDYLISSARESELLGLRRAVKNLSQIVHVGGAKLMACKASTATANQIVGIVHASCERVRLSRLASEFPRIGIEIMQLGCGRIYRAA